MCTNLVETYLDATAQVPANDTGCGLPALSGTPFGGPGGGGGGGALDRVMCSVLWTTCQRLVIAACGPEQTKITYTFANLIAQFPGLNISALNTTRAEGAGCSFFILSDVYGETDSLQTFAAALAARPCLEPRGKRFVPAAVVDLKIIAPDRTKLIRDALGIISVEYGVNVESMINRTYPEADGPGGVFPAFITDAGGGTGGTGGTGGGGTGGGGTGTGGGTGGGGTGGTGGQANRLFPFLGEEVRSAAGEQRFSVSHMRLEIPEGTNLTRLKRDLQKLGQGWKITWAEREPKGVGLRAATRSVN